MDRDKILDALHDHYEESIFVTDGDGNVVFANQVAARRLNCKCEDIEGKNVRDLMEEGVYTNSTTLEAIATRHRTVGALTDNEDTVTFSNSVPVIGENGNVELVVTNNMSLKHSQEWESIIYQDKEENLRLKREIDFLRLHDQNKIIAGSPMMRSLMQTVNAIAPTDSSVVILGQSGTGKDVIARLLHDLSKRSGNAFISINCAAMPETLLESELFGYEGGAFTGAQRGGKIGLFEAASGGTLFLDEVGEMSLGLQSKLLRALENREIRRVGGVKSIPVDVRIICATNRDLAKLVEEKVFREDLYYRLSVFVLSLPPLRERKEDIIPLAQMFLDQLNRKYGMHKILADVTVDTMLNYSWPGNIRELRNVMERIYVISQNNQLVFTPVPTAEYSENFKASIGMDVAPPEKTSFNTLKEYMDHAERQYIEAVLKQHDGSVSKAAESLGIHRSVLYRKLHK